MRRFTVCGYLVEICDKSDQKKVQVMAESLTKAFKELAIE